MKRVLILGNSHVHALKRAWTAISTDWAATVDPTFFVAPHHLFCKLRTDGSTFGVTETVKLSPEDATLIATLNGCTVIDLARFDEMLVAGMFWSGTEDVIPFLRRFAVDTLYEAQKPQRLTLAAFDALAAAQIAAGQIGDFVTGDHGSRVSLMLRPMHLNRVRLLEKHQLNPPSLWCGSSIDFDRMRPLLDRYRDLAEVYYRGIGITLLHQPEETMTPSGLSLESLSEMPLEKLGAPHPAIDPLHLNTEFGRLCLERYLSGIAEPAKPTH